VPVRRVKGVLAGALVLGASSARADCPAFERPASLGSVQSTELVEASGLAASRQNLGVLWSHNDSGHAARLYAMTTSGTHLGNYNLSGTTNIDWEDLAIGPAPGLNENMLWIGDIGDNFNIRSTIRVYRVAEPIVEPKQSPVTVTLTGAQTITMQYPDGPRDAETLMVDTNGDLYIVTKRVSAVGRVYRAAYPQSTSQTITLQFVAQLSWGAVNGNGGATGGDIASDGSAIVVRRTTGFNPAATLWRRPPGTNLWEAFSTTGCDLVLTSERQGEAVAFVPGSRSFITLSEGSNQPLWHYQAIPTVGDVTGDGAVNIDDLLAVINAWGPCPPACPADVTGDNIVNIDDLFTVINSWT
jgi:hypothetical protein